MLGWLFTSAPVIAPSLTPDEKFDVVMSRLDDIEELLNDICEAIELRGTDESPAVATSSVPPSHACDDYNSDSFDDSDNEIDEFDQAWDTRLSKSTPDFTRPSVDDDDVCEYDPSTHARV